MTRPRKFTDAEQAEKRRKYNKAYAKKKKEAIREYYKQYNAGVRGVVIGDKGYAKKCPQCNTRIERTAPAIGLKTLQVAVGKVVLCFD